MKIEELLKTMIEKDASDVHLKAGNVPMLRVKRSLVRTDFPALKSATAGRAALWGGVNGFLTVEMGSTEEVVGAVRQAIDALAGGGGFILSPVDNVRDDSPKAWENVRVLIDFSRGAETWTTVGANTNIIEASWVALADAFEYALLPSNGAMPQQDRQAASRR